VVTAIGAADKIKTYVNGDQSPLDQVNTAAQLASAAASIAGAGNPAAAPAVMELSYVALGTSLQVLKADLGNPELSGAARVSKITSDVLEAVGDGITFAGAAATFAGPEAEPLAVALDAFGNGFTLGTVAYNNQADISGFASNLASQVKTQATQYVNTLENTINDAVVGAGNAVDSALNSVDSAVS